MREPYLDDGDVRLFLGDCVEVMATLEAESVDAVVTDPPYALTGQSRNGSPRTNDPQTPFGRHPIGEARGFMGQTWDGTLPGVECWEQCLRVLRPGGHLLAFGGTRTFHRLTCAIEDAGFEIRDCLSWLYGSGFPKSLDVSKAIDRAAGAEREVVGIADDRNATTTTGMWGSADPEREEYDGSTFGTGTRYHTAPATPEAERWQGWGTALKPAWEPIIVARKPPAGTVAANVLATGCGALNVDGCRVEGAPWKAHRATGLASVKYFTDGDKPEIDKVPHTAGRWPANVILSHTPECREVGTRKVKGSAPQGKGGDWRPNDVQVGPTGLREHGVSKNYADPDGTETVAAWECSPDCPVRLLDEEVGERPRSLPSSTPRRTSMFNGGSPDIDYPGYGDTGGPSRFFKTTEADSPQHTPDCHPLEVKWECSPDCPVRMLDEEVGERPSGSRAAGDYGRLGYQGWDSGPMPAVNGDSGGPSRFFYTAKASSAERDGASHPTVKPLALMRWLVRMVTPPGGLVLDPFAGSGTTGLACREEGMRALLIEREEEYAAMAAHRLRQLSLFGERA